MAVALLSHEVCDLTLGKPSLAWLAASASVRAALVALKQQEDVPEISVWDCAPGSHAIMHQSKGDRIAVGNPHRGSRQSTCRCIGKVCMQKIICYLASEHSLCHLAAALDAPITVLLDEKSTCVQHIDPEASLQEALFAIRGGAQNLVVQLKEPLKLCGRVLRGSMSYNKKSMANALTLKSHNGHEYCWLTHEDVLRFLLGSVGVFSPITTMSIKDLGIIQTGVLMVEMDDDAISALDMIKAACSNTTAVAIVEKDSESTSYQIVGEISCSTFQMCNETAAVALAALSVRDFLAYIQDWRSTPDMLMEAMSAKLSKKLASSESNDESRHVVSQMIHDLEMSEVSSDDEFSVDSPTGPHDLLGKHHTVHFQSNVRFMRSHNGPIFCRPTSSLIAVLMQALAHREHYVWVTNEDDTLVGMVTFADILSVLLNHLNLAC